MLETTNKGYYVPNFMFLFDFHLHSLRSISLSLLVINSRMYIYGGGELEAK